jgi:hypothetical protein
MCIYLGHIANSDSIGHMVNTMFNHLWNYQNVWKAAALFTIPPGMCESSNLSKSSSTLVNHLLIITLLVNMKGHLIVIWIYITLIASDVERIFMHILATCISSLKELKSFAHF